MSSDCCRIQDSARWEMHGALRGVPPSGTEATAWRMSLLLPQHWVREAENHPHQEPFFISCNEIQEDHLQSVSFSGREGATLYVPSDFPRKENLDEAGPWHPLSFPSTPSPPETSFPKSTKCSPCCPALSTLFPPCFLEVLLSWHPPSPAGAPWSLLLPPVHVGHPRGLCNTPAHPPPPATTLGHATPSDVPPTSFPFRAWGIMNVYSGLWFQHGTVLTGLKLLDLRRWRLYSSF